MALHDQMNPNKGAPPPEVKKVDLSSIQPGQTTIFLSPTRIRIG
jgi:hypothetical protein